MEITLLITYYSAFQIFAYSCGVTQAWAFSRTGSDSIKKISFGITHFWFGINRISLFFLCLSFAFLCKTNAIYFFALLTQLGQYSLCHTVAYNKTMMKLKVAGYTTIFQDKSKTDAFTELPNWSEAIIYILSILKLIILYAYA